MSEVKDSISRLLGAVQEHFTRRSPFFRGDGAILFWDTHTHISRKTPMFQMHCPCVGGAGKPSFEGGKLGNVKIHTSKPRSQFCTWGLHCFLNEKLCFKNKNLQSA